MGSTRKITSEILASIALALLLIYIIDVGVSMINESHGFIPLSAKDRGMIFGGGSILLFIVSFGIGINVTSKLLTVMLIVGGAIMGTTVLLSSLLLSPSDQSQMSSISESKNRMLAPQSLGIILIGYVILGMGILRAIKYK
jgi:hypothetical protein